MGHLFLVPLGSEWVYQVQWTTHPVMQLRTIHRFKSTEPHCKPCFRMLTTNSSRNKQVPDSGYSRGGSDFTVLFYYRIAKRFLITIDLVPVRIRWTLLLFSTATVSMSYCLRWASSNKESVRGSATYFSADRYVSRDRSRRQKVEVVC